MRKDASKRVFISGIIQETNTFCPVRTEIDAFQRGFLLYGQDIREKLYETNTEFSGFYRGLEKAGNIDVRSGIAAWSVASGPITEQAFNFLIEKLLQKLDESLPIDGIAGVRMELFAGEVIDASLWYGHRKAPGTYRQG